jgi:CRP-like cAMP-binding protein
VACIERGAGRHAIVTRRASQTRRRTADAIIDSTVWLTKRESLFRGLTEAAAALKLVNRSLEHVENHLLLLGSQTSLERTAAFLPEMDRRLEQPALMMLVMSRRDIADLERYWARELERQRRFRGRQGR